MVCDCEKIKKKPDERSSSAGRGPSNSNAIRTPELDRNPSPASPPGIMSRAGASREGRGGIVEWKVVFEKGGRSTYSTYSEGRRFSICSNKGSASEKEEGGENVSKG